MALLTWGGGVPTGYAQIDQKAIVGVWLFDEGGGKTASDSSGNGHDGKIGNGIKWIAGQYSSKALHFPGAAVVGPQLWLYRMKYLLTC